MNATQFAKSERGREADQPSSQVARFGADQPLQLDCGIALASFQVAYQTYGRLNDARSNAILICHALTGDQHVANIHPVTGKPGWWEAMVGPGRPVDTDRYFVICSNVVGGCMGSTGPCLHQSGNRRKPWGLDFPVITIRDMVRAQAMLIDHLGIETLFACSAARWAACRCCNGRHPILIACSARCRLRRRRVTRRRTSRFMKWADRR